MHLVHNPQEPHTYSECGTLCKQSVPASLQIFPLHSDKQGETWRVISPYAITAGLFIVPQHVGKNETSRARRGGTTMKKRVVVC